MPSNWNSVPLVALLGSDGATILSATNPIVEGQLDVNGNVRPRYANRGITLLPLAARTATTNSADQLNLNWRGVMLVLNVTAVVGGNAGLQVIIQQKDPTSGAYNNLCAAPTAVTTVSFATYQFYPGVLTTNGNIKATSNIILPDTWRAQVIHGDSDSYTYSLSASLIV